MGSSGFIRRTSWVFLLFASLLSPLVKADTEFFHYHVGDEDRLDTQEIATPSSYGDPQLYEEAQRNLPPHYVPSKLRGFTLEEIANAPADQMSQVIILMKRQPLPMDVLNGTKEAKEARYRSNLEGNRNIQARLRSFLATFGGKH
jgi:hypothetical protein